MAKGKKTINLHAILIKTVNCYLMILDIDFTWLSILLRHAADKHTLFYKSHGLPE
jgi:hypothetical protein